MDCVTQYEAMATCERISEAFLIPVLEEMLLSFPFVIRGFHSDNGSEYVNRHEQYLKPGICFAQLDALASASSDNDAAQRLNQARARLFRSFSKRSKSAA